MMYLHLPTPSIFFRSQSHSRISDSSSSSGSVGSPGRRSRSSSRLVAGLSHGGDCSSPQEDRKGVHFVRQQWSLEKSGDERCYLVAAYRKDGSCLNLMAGQDDGEYISFPSLESFESRENINDARR